MVDPTSIAGMFGSTVQNLVSQIYYLVGGLFGIYVILIALRWWEYRMMKGLLKDIKSELRHLNQNMCGSVPLKNEPILIKHFKTIKDRLNGKNKKKTRKKGRK